MATGTVKWFKADKGFGFITPMTAPTTSSDSHAKSGCLTEGHSNTRFALGEQQSRACGPRWFHRCRSSSPKQVRGPEPAVLLDAG
jgi:'Cold-shock' DNA-binding domain